MGTSLGQVADLPLLFHESESGVNSMNLILFAQKGKGEAEAVAAAAMGFMALYFCVVFTLAVVGISLRIWWFVTCYQALNACSPRKRDMEPAMIFLNLIPLFGFVWYFFIVIRIASSLTKEYDDRGLRQEGDFGQLFGILAPLIPCVGLVLYIMWILRTRGYTAKLAGGGKRRSRDDDDDED